MVALTLILIWTMSVLVSGMELKRRKNVVVDHGDNEKEDLGSSKSVDESKLRQSKRKRKEDVESIEDSSGSHKCRFCTKSFKQSQALGGHMNCHRQEKDREVFEKAEKLLASNSPYAANNLWNIQPYNAPPNYNHMPPQRNTMMNPPPYNVPPNYNPMPPQRNTMMSPPPAQFQGQQASAHVYSDSKRFVMHGHGLDMMQSHGQSSVIHNSNIQGPDTLLDMMDMPTNYPLPSNSFIRQAAFYRQINHQHGNLVGDYQPAHSSQIMLQDNYKPPQIPEPSQHGSSTLMEPVQARIDPHDTIDSSGKLL